MGDYVLRIVLSDVRDEFNMIIPGKIINTIMLGKSFYHINALFKPYEYLLN